LEAVNKLKGQFDQDDLTLLETLAASASIALHNAYLLEAQRQYTAQVEARNEELDAFAHTVAHDLKSPLALVVGHAAVLEDAHAGMTDEELSHWLSVIAKSGRKMSAIIDELLMLSCVRLAKNVETQPLDMANIVAEVQDRLAPMIKDCQAEIILPETWPVALGYAPWIEEVWANYLSNALKYGGQPPRVALGAEEQEDGKVRFWVHDNGAGIPLEERRRLFTPFSRLDQVRRVKGHGLGLSIVRRVVKRLGGEVGVESGEGRGSTFFFTLPGTERAAGDKAGVGTYFAGCSSGNDAPTP
jgi:signal transduction histidine kinase